MRLLILLALLTLTARGWAAEPLQNKPPEDSWRRLHQVLQQRVDADFTNTPLDEVVRRLRQQTGVRMVIDKFALDELGLGLDEPLSVHVQAVT
ncbi:MAG: hypothetical protein KDA37_15615, partial [Planctomycetales bacterium]|nr:hypothetical protein [Planctomycetales bacterium]